MANAALADDGTLLYLCPGCRQHHGVNAARWNWNGDLEAPTLSPSVKHTYPDGTVCHYFIRGGLIEYCSDSAHSLAGRTVPMRDVEGEFE